MNELIPCPTCFLPADLTTPAEGFPHTLCPKGHDNSVVPAVLKHLRSLDPEKGQ